ncbi:Protein SDA1 [Dirofilaria immitis]|nr:Protein SDA1 [Dirofilaria immitis]
MPPHLETNLGLLQELINKDPESYKEEFLEQYTSTSSHYPKESKEYATNIMEILNTQLTGLDPEIRVAFCKALIIMRNRKIIDLLTIIDLFFTLIPYEDKNLRLGFLRDAKTANALAECCLHKISRIQIAAIKFFLGCLEDDDSDNDENENEEEDQKTLKEITRILLYVAQACHELVPPDIVEQLVYVIAQNFVSDRNTSEAMTVGLNTIREIFAICPFAATEHLLRDLTEYKRFKNKNVSMAARAIITLFRTINPKLLHKKDQGRPTEVLKGLEITEFGVEHPKEFVEGVECLSVGVNALDADLMQSNEIDDTDFDTEFVEKDSLDMDGSVDSFGNHLNVSSICVENENFSSKTILETNNQKTTSFERKEKARQICEARILTQDDFCKINAFRLKQQVGYDGKRKNTAVKLEEELEENIARKFFYYLLGSSKDGIMLNKENGLTRLKDIEKFHKKLRRETKEERMEAGAHVGRTNRELMKRKNFQMVRHKLRGKNRQRSFKERQESLRKYLLRQAGRKI